MINNIDDEIEKLEIRPKFILNIEKLRLLKINCRECIKNTKEDKELFKLYYLMALIERSFLNYDMSLEYLKKAEQVSYVLNDIIKGKLYIVIGRIYSKLKNKEQSNIYLEKGFELIKDYDLENDEVLSAHVQGILISEHEDYDKEELNKNIDVIFNFMDKKYDKKYTYYYIILGSRYTQLLTNYTSAMKCFIRVLQLADKYNVIEAKSMALYYIGVCYYDGMRKYKEAIRYLEPLVYNSKYEFVDINLRIASIVTLIQCYFKTNNFDNIDFCFEYIEKNKNKLSNFVEQSIDTMVKYLKAEMFLIRYKDIDKALEYVLDAKENYDSISADNFAFTIFDFNLIMLMGKIYFALEQYEMCIDIYKNNISCGKRYGITYELMVYEALADAYEKVGDYNSSLKYYRIYDKLFFTSVEEQSMEDIHKEFESTSKKYRIQELSKINKIIEKDLYTDALTSLFNRKYLNNLIKDNRKESNVGVMMLDIDFFKLYNDNYGHIMGDEVLEKVSSVIKECCNDETDIAIRYGGEEFLIISYTKDIEYIGKLSKSIKDSLYKINIEHKYSKISNRVSISSGTANGFVKAKEDYLKLIEEADNNLYREKRYRIS